MSVTFQTTVSQMRAAQHQLNNLNIKFKKELSNLSQIEKRLNSSWKSDAQAAFDKQFNMDITKMEAFHKAVKDYVVKLDAVIDDYQKTEKANVTIAGH